MERFNVRGVTGIVALAGATLLLAPTYATATSTPAESLQNCGGARVAPHSLRMNGVLGVAETFTGSLRLTGLRKGAQPFFLASALVSTDSIPHRISTSEIEITNLDAPLEKGESRDVKITAKDVRFAGEYKGVIRADRGACRIALTVVASGAADVSFVGGADKTLHLQMVNCRTLSCGPGGILEFLTRAAARRDEFAPQVDNASQSPAQVTGVQIALTRNPGGEVIAPDALRSSAQQFELLPQSTSVLKPIEVKRSDLDPGHYMGAIYLTVLGADKRVALPLELDVKVGPLYAIIAILIALLVQFLIWFAGRTKARAEELRELRSLRKKTRSLALDDRVLLEGRLDAARDLALHGRLDAAKEARAAIGQYIEWLGEVRTLLIEVEKAHPGKPLPDGISEPLGALRKAIERGDTTAAKAAQTDLWAFVGKSPKVRATPGAEIFYGRQPRSGRQKTEGESARRGRQLSLAWTKLRAWAKRVWHRTGRVIVWLSIYALPWVLRTILVVAFILAGLKELYLDNSTFGSDPVLNYSTLFLWGLTGSGVNALLGKVIPGAGSG